MRHSAQLSAHTNEQPNRRGQPKNKKCNPRPNPRKHRKQSLQVLPLQNRALTLVQSECKVITLPRESPNVRDAHLPYTLPFSVCSKCFVCHSYENCRGVRSFFPFRLIPLSCFNFRISSFEFRASPLATILFLLAPVSHSLHPLESFFYYPKGMLTLQQSHW